MGSHDDLEMSLRALGEHVGPPTPPPADVARAVRARLESASGTEADGPRAPSERTGGAHGPDRRRWRPRKRWIATGVAVVLAVLLGLTPQGQAAVERVLRFAGIELQIGDPGPLPSGVPRALPGETRVTLDEARDMAPFPFRVPAELGAPKDVRVAEDGRLVSMFWPGVRLDAFAGVMDVLWRKELGPPFPQQVTVGESQGWWVQAPHGITYLPRDGVGAKDLARVAGPTLIWQLDLAGYRLEGVPDVTRALEIAVSLR
ncbi:hypothetical protein ABGB17_22165 [Sphaerisporangium sp. B11E5]|uniref:hypothetical protein n=1 Tax=Sphaerisporangium sp. B11E5 TaxID=3153563 RepID=UPI00325CACEB